MRVPFSWLADFIELEGLTPEEVADRLSLQSVEAVVETFGIELDGVVFGKVLEASDHPQDKRLRVLRVEVSSSGFAITVVTADGSVSEGEGVIVALPNSRVGEVCVSKRKFGDVVSEGMLLSAKELGLEDGSEGVLKLEEDLKPGTDAKDLLGFGEKIIELDITPNRGDMLSVRGLARDISAIFGLERKSVETEPLEECGELSIEIEDGDCFRYRGVVVENVEVKNSPLKIRRRLWQSGFKSINNVVDITNYILLQEGQPLHAFDLDKLEGGIVVRSARKGEKIVTLDGEERELSEDNLVIADLKGPVAVAGVVGGLESSVTSGTKRILLESAYFEPKRIRRSSKSLGVQTESSYRFERNVDIERVNRAQDLATQLILEVAGGEVSAVRDVYLKKYEPKKVFLSFGKYMRYAGEGYKNEEITRILSSLEIPHEVKRCGVEVLVPSHRSFDISRDVDLIEEIMRIKGYDNFSAETLKLPAKGKLWKDELLEIRKYLRDRGLSEVINISYEDLELYELLGLEKPAVEIVNPLVRSQRFMRSSLIPSLLRTAKFNENHYNYDLSIFELGRVFLRDGEEDRVGIFVKGGVRAYPEEKWDAYKLSGIVQGMLSLFGAKPEFVPSKIGFLHPHIQAEILLKGEVIGFIGKLHPEISQRLELKGEAFVSEVRLPSVLGGKLSQYSRISKFPPVIRDLALLVDKSLPVSKLLNEIKSQLKGKVEEVMVFDLYAGDKVGEGKKSVGVRIVFRSLEGSLSGEEVNTLVEGLVRRLRESLGVDVR
jgi:phenylalanyl-tRNA synthetase beta chain